MERKVDLPYPFETQKNLQGSKVNGQGPGEKGKTLMCYIMAIWVSLVNGCRKFCCCGAKKQNKNSKEIDLEKNGNIELSTEIQEALLAEEEKNQIQRKYEKELSAKTCKIEELQYKLSELENELEDVRFENKELSKNAKIPSISKVPSISSKELSQKSESGAAPEEVKLEARSESSTESKTEKIENLAQQCESLQFEVELKNKSIQKLQTSLNQVLLRNEKLDQEITRLEKASQVEEEKEEKLRRLTEDNARLKEDLDKSLNEREMLQKEVLNTSQDVEQLQYRLNLSSTS